MSGLTRLGQVIIECVRDGSISDLRMVLDGSMKGDDAKEIRDGLSSLSVEQLRAVADIIPAIVDQVVHNVLSTVEQRSELELSFRDGIDDCDASEESDGLAGELYGTRGWIASFSRFST